MFWKNVHFCHVSLERSCSYRDRSGLQKKLRYKGPLGGRSLFKASSTPVAGVAITG